MFLPKLYEKINNIIHSLFLSLLLLTLISHNLDIVKYLLFTSQTCFLENPLKNLYITFCEISQKNIFRYNTVYDDSICHIG